MCGEHYIQNIVVATTMWGTIPSTSMEEALAREAELYTSKSFWGDMIKRGARYIRWDASSEDAQDIVEKCLTKSEAPPLAILLELTNGITQEETSAGQILTEQIRQRRESERAELEEEQEVNKALLIRKTDLEEQVNNAIMENQRQYEIARTAPPPTSYHERRQWEQGFGPVNVVDGYLQPVNFYPAQDERMRAQQVQVQSQNQGRHVLRRRRASGSDTGKKPWYEMTLRKWH
ncbi:hypothetical protein E6O75_ATG09280 [Venturia nashicola]|uniref:Uncharacterized protein n=1 Tax=Venturia nashicola TaxID=86259 RepID=A0A4Z1NFP9_9PEZI|nr:hypothetical protein E6O75_ATG09280 [Venturia nashicola]